MSEKLEEFDRLFQLQSTGERREKHIALYDHAREFVEAIDLIAPASREKSLALTKLQECLMWANAAVARES
jgi:hypothetical protein